ncbi:MAG: translation initiation factor eIF-1A [Candidatus Micrarchaeota archaeon]
MAGYRGNRGGHRPAYRPAAPGDAPIRVRLPEEGEVLGVVMATLGGGRLQVQCKDGKERIGRIPGKIRRNIWVRHNDVVIIKPWSIDGEKHGDVIWRYNHIQVDWLRNKGYISR